MMTPPSLSRIEDLARAARAALPEAFQAAAAQVVLQVVARADDAMLAEFGLSDPEQLTGLYDGIPLTEKSAFDQAYGPDVIWLFRDAIWAEYQERGNEDLADLVAHVYVHELAHHFGWSDDDIATIDRWWE